MIICWNCAHCGCSQFEARRDHDDRGVKIEIDQIDSAVKHCTCCSELHIHNGFALPPLLSSIRPRLR